MSLLGIDVGTTGCKTAVFSSSGNSISSAYEEYDFKSPEPGQAELDSAAVWEKIKKTIARAVTEADLKAGEDPVAALSVSSLGEAMVPVTSDRRILGPSLLNFDVRGEGYLEALQASVDKEWLYRINGNTLGNHYGLTKLMWIKEHRPGLYEQTYKFLHWGSFVAFMLGAEPAVDYSLANRSLLFNLDRKDWSDELLNTAGLDRATLPSPRPSGTVIGKVSKQAARELGLPENTAILTGAHDQCSNAVGCGVIREGSAMFGLGTYLCIVPVFSKRIAPGLMLERGLNTEHHALPDRFVSFIYNQTGSIVKWFRDTFAAAEHRLAQSRGEDIYERLFAELPDSPGPVMVLPHFSTMGPPDFISGSSGLFAGLKLSTTRGEILKGICEGSVFSLRKCVELLPGAGIEINDYRAVGGGSKSDRWIQTCADILNRPFVRPTVTEAGALGAAIMAGAGTGVFASIEEGSRAMVRLEKTFTPDPERAARYDLLFQKYRRLWPLLKEYLREL